MMVLHEQVLTWPVYILTVAYNLYDIGYIAKMYPIQTWEEDQIGILSNFLRNFNNLFDNGFIRHNIIFISLFQKVNLLHGRAEFQPLKLHGTAENGPNNG